MEIRTYCKSLLKLPRSSDSGIVAFWFLAPFHKAWRGDIIHPFLPATPPIIYPLSKYRSICLPSVHPLYYLIMQGKGGLCLSGCQSTQGRDRTTKWGSLQKYSYPLFFISIIIFCVNVTDSLTPSCESLQLLPRLTQAYRLLLCLMLSFTNKLTSEANRLEGILFKGIRQIADIYLQKNVNMYHHSTSRLCTNICWPITSLHKHFWLECDKL